MSVACEGLVLVVGDGNDVVLHLATGEVIASGMDFTCHRDIPVWELNETRERLAAEADGQQYNGDFPGWKAIANYIIEHGGAV